MAVGLLLAGLGLTGLSTVGSLLTQSEEPDIKEIYGAAKSDVDKAYDAALENVRNRFRASEKKLKQLYPENVDKIDKMFDVKENEYFQKLRQNLDKQKEQLISEITQAGKKGKIELQNTLARMGSAGGRAAAQLAKVDESTQRQLSKGMLEQDIQQNQLMANLLNQWGLSGAQAKAGLLGQQTGALANLYGQQPGLEGQLGASRAGSLANLYGQQAGQQVQQARQPSPLAGAFGQVGQLGGTLMGQYFPERRQEQMLGKQEELLQAIQGQGG